VGLEKAVKAKTGKDLGGVGFWMVDGVLSQQKGSARRYWHSELQKLNETYKIPCYGNDCGSAGDDPFKPTPPPPPPAAHGSYTVQSGDGCWAIADRFCQDGNNWKTDICNADSVCAMLHPGQTINYDCSGKGAFCNGGPAKMLI